MAAVDVSNLIAKLVPLLKDEVTLLRDVHDKINQVTKELSLIQAYLKDADAKAEMADTTASHAIKEWVKQLREAAFRIQDAVDLYLFNLALNRPQIQRHRIAGVLCKIGFAIRSVLPRHKITSDIDSITSTIRRLKEQRDTLGLSPLPPGNDVTSYTPPARTARLDLRMGAHFLDDDELVGVDHTKTLLNQWLMHGQSIRTVIAVVGEGGLGKTTIVKNVYSKYKENGCFECCAWITVSRPLEVEHLLKTLLRSLYENDHDDKYAANEISDEVMNKDTLTEKLREYLQGRNYMIVFDDVWAIDFWGGVEFALPTNRNKDCRIIITTRDKGVAEFCGRFALVHIHVLEPLHPNDALNLFLLKTFQFDSQGCPSDLDELSRAFVNKCEGVPLAIVAIAGLLSTKRKNVYEWKKVYDSLRSKLSSDPHLRSFYQVLSESYHDLPSHLKLCLLYFGLFPVGYTITRTRLIRLWVAESFVSENDLCEDQTLEEAAEEYLAELIRRSLVKVFDVHAYGGVESCRVHDLMHDFIVRKCEQELNFFQVVKNQQFRFHEWTRRLSIHKGGFITKGQNYSLVRSCIVCDTKLTESKLKSLLSSFKLLVTLDLEDSPIDHLPEAVGNLLNLKYLSVRKTKIKTIPKFIGKLQKLEILDIGDTKVRELPKETNRLVKLQHLFSYVHDFSSANGSYMKGVKLNEGIGALTDLQSLVLVDTTHGDGIIREMGNLKNMRRLGIINLSKGNGNMVCSAIQSMPHLCSLEISSGDQHEDLELQSLVDPPVNMQRLYLQGRLRRLPEWIPKLKHLVKLRLKGSRLEEDPLPMLEGLPELLELVLDSSYDGEELHFKFGWFMKLRCLSLAECDCLTTLKIDKGALPNLEILWLWSIPRMVKVPRDIQNLETLKQLDVKKMPTQFVDDISTGWKKNSKLRIAIIPTMTHGR